MRITGAEITGFRNLANLNLADVGPTNLIVGRNAQGKTNLLEALAATVLGGSFRFASDRAVIGHNETVARARATFVTDAGRESEVMITWSLGGEAGRWLKQIKLNGVVSRADELIRTFPGVIFSPEDIDLIRLSPGYRRRFMDRALSAADLEYQQTLLEYVRILKQRNQLLLLVKQGRADEAEIDTWDEQMAEAGVALVAKRKKFIYDLGTWAGQLYRRLFGAETELKISYVPSIDEEFARNYLERLRATRSLDIVRTTSSKGAHRDDITFWLNGRDVRTTASRGEFRSIVIALKLAEGKTLSRTTGETPMYFLDDVLSELDETRRGAIARELLGSQVWLTTSDIAAVSLFETPAVLALENGVVQSQMPIASGG